MAGNEPGGETVSASNVEWGEDVGSLADHLGQRGEMIVSGTVAGGVEWRALRRVCSTQIRTGANTLRCNR